MELLAVKDLTFTYPGEGRPALRNLSFSVEEGEFLVICGKSGCGKTTLLRHFKTAMSPYGNLDGEILLEGKKLSEVSVREQASRIGYVLQSPDNQIVTDKVWHELAFGMENLGYDPGVIRLRVAEMASFFGIQAWFEKKVDELSGGQKQMLNLASVMAMQPDLLVLDEPTSQLDPLAAGEFLATLRKINAELGTTIILIEHRLEEVLSYADRVLVLEDGEILAFERPGLLAKALKGNDMFLAMPAPMRLFDGLNGEGNSPVTVREGREWLAGFQKGKKRGKDRPDTYKEPSARPQKKREEKRESFVFETRDVWFRYEKNLPDVVRDLNMQVRTGELYCLLGGNGTGKTTTLSLLGRLRKPYRGRIFLKGKEIGKYKESDLFGKTLGILPQNPQCLFVKDTLEGDLLEVAGRKKDPEKVRRVAELTEITHLLKSHPYDLSGGEQQRAALAKVLLLDPEVLLLDEPTKGMDSFYKQKLAGVFANLLKEGKTILMVSHDIEFCAEHADTCALFFNGSIVTSGPAKTFFCGNSFYTTAANRMARKWYPMAVTVKDVMEQWQES